MKSKGMASIFDKQFIGTDGMRKNLTKILKEIGKTRELIVTQSGRPQAVLLDFKTYLSLTSKNPNAPNTLNTSRAGRDPKDGQKKDVKSGTIFSFHSNETSEEGM